MDLRTVAYAIFSVVGGVALIQYIAKRAVDHAFNSQLEGRREEFARELAAQRHAAEMALKAFEAQLTLGAEVRRVVAIKKVESLLRIVELGQPLFGELTKLGQNDVAGWSRVAGGYFDAVRAAQHFFSAEATNRMNDYAIDVARAEQAFRNLDTTAYEKARQHHDAFIDLIRGELHIPTSRLPAKEV